jgi:hypothetical protein
LLFLILGILKALVRDGFRCIFTGFSEFRLLGKCTEVDQELEESDVDATSTACAHIFPQSSAMYAASIWTIMSYFGFEDLREKLVGNGIHTLENVMTLDLGRSLIFQRLALWFEAIVSGVGIFIPRTEGLQDDQDNTYAIRARSNGILLACRDNPVTLTSHHPDLPLPNRTFLAIHAACCRIADLSGAAEYIHKTIRDY